MTPRRTPHPGWLWPIPIPGWKALSGPPRSRSRRRETMATVAMATPRRTTGGRRLDGGFKYTPERVQAGGGIILNARRRDVVFGLGVSPGAIFNQESPWTNERRVAKTLGPAGPEPGSTAPSIAFAASCCARWGGDAGKDTTHRIFGDGSDIITNYGLNARLIRDVASDRAHANRYLVHTTSCCAWGWAGPFPRLGAFLLLRQLLRRSCAFGLGAFSAGPAGA